MNFWEFIDKNKNGIEIGVRSVVRLAFLAIMFLCFANEFNDDEIRYLILFFLGEPAISKLPVRLPRPPQTHG